MRNWEQSRSCDWSCIAGQAEELLKPELSLSSMQWGFLQEYEARDVYDKEKAKV